MRVTILQSDIDEGVRGDCFRCAVARALARVTGDDHARISSVDGLLYAEAWSRWITLPWLVAVFVHEFDNGVAVRPFRFDLPDDVSAWCEQCVGCEPSSPRPIIIEEDGSLTAIFTGPEEDDDGPAEGRAGESADYGNDILDSSDRNL